MVKKVKRTKDRYGYIIRTYKFSSLKHGFEFMTKVRIASGVKVDNFFLATSKGRAWWCEPKDIMFKLPRILKFLWNEK